MRILNQTNTAQPKITVTLAGTDNKKVTLLTDEIISVERSAENIFLTHVHCKSKRHYLIVESIGEVTTQLEIQLMAYS